MVRYHNFQALLFVSRYIADIQMSDKADRCAGSFSRILVKPDVILFSFYKVCKESGSPLLKGPLSSENHPMSFILVFRATSFTVLLIMSLVHHSLTSND